MRRLPTEQMQELKALLDKNFAVLGFTLEMLNQYEFEGDSLVNWCIVQGKTLCPCGGVERFSGVVDCDRINVCETARDILSAVAGREHIAKDVKEGRLPPSAMDECIFKSLVV